MSNKKQKERFSITNTTNQDFRNFLKKFKNSTYLGYKSKQIQDEPTEDYLLIIKHITKLMKTERNVRICTNFVKSCINKKIGHINKTIGHINKSIQSEELESNNKIITCPDKDRQTLSAYDITDK